MKRNLFLSLWLMIAAMLFIVSCKSELLDDDNQSVKNKQNLMVKQLRYDELKKQSPAIVEKISKFQKQNLAEVNSRIYHDTEEGFSVDTEKSLYIEDGEENKTYTFKIVRAENNSGILENLVLKDIGNSEFEAYISTYDNVAVQNYANLSLEEIKSHVTITPIGKVNGSDIFGRMNANSCQITAISNMYDVYVPGTTCASYLHHTFSQLVECQHDVKPTSGYYNTITEYTTYDSCQSGGSTTGNGSGTVNTGPYNGGYNGSGGFGLLDDPCVNIKQENIKAKNLLNIPVVKAQDSIMKIGISTSTIEKAFTFGKDSTGTYQVSAIINGPAGGGAVSMPATNPNFTTEGGGHNHDTTTYDVPSTGDIYWFHTVHTTNPHFNYYYTNGANTGAEYVYVITNPTDFANFPTTYSVATYFDPTGGWKSNASIGKDFDLVEAYFLNVGKSDEEAKELAQAFVIGKYNMGVGISKKDSTGNFQPIFVEEISNYVPTGNPSLPLITVKTYQLTTTCNLK